MREKETEPPDYLPFLLTTDGRDFAHARHISLMFLFCSHDQEDTPFGAFCSSSSSWLELCLP